MRSDGMEWSDKYLRAKQLLRDRLLGRCGWMSRLLPFLIDPKFGYSVPLFVDC